MGILATLVDVLAVFIAGYVGGMLKDKINTGHRQLLVQGCGIVALVLGLWGIFDEMFLISETQLELEGSMLVVFALAAGWGLGHLLHVSQLMQRIGLFLRNAMEGDPDKTNGNVRRDRRAAAKAGVSIDPMPGYESVVVRSGSGYVDGFVLATVLVCSGYMMMRGIGNIALEQGPSVLFIKSAVDAVLVLALGMVYGKGTAMAALPLFLIQGLTTVFVAPNAVLATDKIVGQLAVTAAAIMVMVGVTLAFEKKCKVEKLLPAYAIVILYQWIVPAITEAVKNGK